MLRLTSAHGLDATTNGERAVYGMIHKAARDLAVSRIGAAEWERLACEAGLSDGDFIGVEYYPDAQTLRLVERIAQRLGGSLSETLHAFGRHWIDFAGASAFARMLQMTGDDLETFITNLDRMHASIKSSMPRASLPCFDVVASDAGAIHVRYRSERAGLAPFVAGVLSGVAQRLGERVGVSWVEEDGGALFVLTRVAPGA